jgi:hypothetical protein
MPRGEPAARPTGRRHRRDTVPRRTTDGPGVRAAAGVNTNITPTLLKERKRVQGKSLVQTITHERDELLSSRTAIAVIGRSDVISMERTYSCSSTLLILVSDATTVAVPLSVDATAQLALSASAMLRFKATNAAVSSSVTEPSATMEKSTSKQAAPPAQLVRNASATPCSLLGHRGSASADGKGCAAVAVRRTVGDCASLRVSASSVFATRTISRRRSKRRLHIFVRSLVQVSVPVTLPVTLRRGLVESAARTHTAIVVALLHRRHCR